MFEEILEKNNEFSLGKIILMFYVLISSAGLFPLLSKQWKKTLENDRVAQHLLGILTILSLTILVSNGKFSIQRIFVYTVLGYLLFIFSTKMDLHFTIMVIVLLISFYLYQNIIQSENNKIMDDSSLTMIEKENLQKNKKHNYVYLGAGLVGIILIGTILYSNKKEVQYGGGYSLLNYLIY
jgi:hypothetical protein